MRCCTGGTALHAAVKAGATKAVEVLLANNACIDLHDRDGYAPLHEAANEPVIAELLLDHGANPEIQNSHNHLQPLHMAARHGSLAVCRLLLSAGADVTAVSKDLSTPLHEAGEAAQTEVIQLLVAHGASCLVEDKHHMTPLSTALRKSFASAAPDAEDKLVESVTVLLSHDNSTRGKGQAWPELEEAALGGHAGVVQLLLNKGAAASDAALTVASGTGHLEVVKLLLRHRSSAKQALGEEPNALHMAARVGHAEVAELLLEQGADVAGASCNASGSAVLCWGVLSCVKSQDVLCDAELCCHVKLQAVLCYAVLCCCWAGLCCPVLSCPVLSCRCPMLRYAVLFGTMLCCDLM